MAASSKAKQQHHLLQTASEIKAAAVETRRQDVHLLQQQEAAQEKHGQLHAERVANYSQLGSKQLTAVTGLQRWRQADAEDLERLIAHRLNAIAGRREERCRPSPPAMPVVSAVS